MTDKTFPITINPDLTGTAFAAALEAERPALMALREEDLIRNSRLDVPTAFAIALATATRAATYRGSVVAQFGEQAGVLLDTLTVTAMAARQADIELDAADRPADLSAMHREVLGAHTLLLTDAESLVNRGFIAPERLDNARSTLGYQQTVDSLLVLVTVLRAHWASIRDVTPIKQADIDRAELLALQMATAMSSRDHGTHRVAAAELRTRAITKLIKQYDQIRRVLTYVRWDEEDADVIAPSFYARRPRRTEDAEATPTQPATPGAPVVEGQPSPTPGPAFGQ